MKNNIMGLVFPFAVSLEKWVTMGIFDREKMIYESHLKRGDFHKIIWFTYGVNDEKIAQALITDNRLDSRICVVGCPIKYKNKLKLYEVKMFSQHKAICENLTVIKTDQMSGAYAAVLISKKYGIPLWLRTGYTYSWFKACEIKEIPFGLKKIKKYIWYFVCCYLYEKKAYSECTYSVVSSIYDMNYIQKKHRVSTDKISVITNYIDCEKFFPYDENYKRKNRFLFVGRLCNQKNLMNLVRAFGRLGIGLDIYGDGELKCELERLVRENNWDINVCGGVDNSELPHVYNEYKFFILPSYYEGMPKSLLEAMACGLICVGTNVRGINEVLKNGINGYIIDGVSEDKIFGCIEELMVSENKDIEKKVRMEAVKSVMDYHSLQKIVSIEYDLMKSIGVII